MLNDLKEIIRIKSERGAPAVNAPYGQGCKDALDWFLAKAQSYGLDTKNVDDRAAWAQIGHGDECVGVLCHLDVVPAGEGWNTPPYELTEKDGKLIGRGIVDNKGPLVVILHILKELKENNIKLKRRVRLIVGCDEENGSSCIKHYVKNEEMPVMSFVPDAEFPLIHSEKGILQFEHTTEKDADFHKNLLYIKGGIRPNVIPDSAEFCIKKPSPLYDYLLEINGGKLDDGIFTKSPLVENIVSGGHEVKQFSLIENDCSLIVKARGVSGHASRPSEGDNALWKIFTLLNALKGVLNTPKLAAVDYRLCNVFAPERLSIACSDINSGDLTINFGGFEASQNNYKLTLDMRLPLTANKDTCLDNVERIFNGKTNVLDYKPNLYVDKNSPLVKTLCSVYSRHMDGNAEPVISGGGTYARELKTAVAFGPAMQGIPTNIHTFNENIDKTLFEKLYAVYYDAICELANA